MRDTEKPAVLPQVLSTVAISLGACLVGGWLSFTSVAIPKMAPCPANFTHSTACLNSSSAYPDSDPIQVDDETGSWIVSSFYLGNVVGCLLGGAANQLVGVRKIMILFAPVAAASWVMVALAQQVWVILLSRVISGFLFGIFQANGKVYNAEVAHPTLRGCLGTLLGNMLALGSLYTYTTGYLIKSWRTVAWLQLLPVSILAISVFFVPDSPYWLVERGREKEARQALLTLRGPHYNIEPEFAEIVNKKHAKEALGRGVAETLGSRVFLSPLLRVGALLMITEWTGINVIGSYMVTIFKESGSSLDPELCPILVSGIQQLLATASSPVLRVAPRKPLFLACATMIAVSYVGLGTYQYLRQTDPGLGAGLVPLLCLLSVSAFRNVGFMVVITLLQAESFPTEIRAHASGICGALQAVNVFGSSKLFPFLTDNLDYSGTFWLYGAVMMVEVVYGALIIPENTGQSLVETEDKMAGGGVETGLLLV